MFFTHVLIKQSLAQELRDATLKLSPEALYDRAAVGEREEAGFIGVAKHGYGCRVVQRIMEHCLLPGWKDDICRQVRARSASYAIRCALPLLTPEMSTVVPLRVIEWHA